MKAAERQSFTGAAEALRIERSQVTRRIQALEKALVALGRSVDEVYQALLKHNLQPVMSDYIYV